MESSTTLIESNDVVLDSGVPELAVPEIADPEPNYPHAVSVSDELLVILIKEIRKLRNFLR